MEIIKKGTRTNEIYNRIVNVLTEIEFPDEVYKLIVALSVELTDLYNRIEELERELYDDSRT